MKKILLLLLLAISLGNAYAQQIRFVYDAAGNQTAQYLLAIRSVNPQGEEQEENPAHKMLADYEVTIYPNPTQGQLTVEIRTDKDELPGTIRLFTLQGESISQIPLQIPHTELNMSGHPDGTYILQIETEGEKNSWKIIKKSL